MNLVGSKNTSDPTSLVLQVQPTKTDAVKTSHADDFSVSTIKTEKKDSGPTFSCGWIVDRFNSLCLWISEQISQLLHRLFYKTSHAEIPKKETLHVDIQFPLLVEKPVDILGRLKRTSSPVEQPKDLLRKLPQTLTAISMQYLTLNDQVALAGVCVATYQFASTYLSHPILKSTD